MKGLVDFIKNTVYRMIHIGLWDSKLDVTVVVGVVVFLVVSVLDTIGFMLASVFSGAKITFIISHMTSTQVAMFWFFFVFTLKLCGFFFFCLI